MTNNASVTNFHVVVFILALPFVKNCRVFDGSFGLETIGI